MNRGGRFGPRCDGWTREPFCWHDWLGVAPGPAAEDVCDVL